VPTASSEAGTAGPAQAGEAAAGGDWEDDADAGPAPAGEAPQPGTSPFAASPSGGGRVTYSRDFLIKLREQPAAKNKPELLSEIVRAPLSLCACLRASA
jgi:hypothetical protein